MQIGHNMGSLHSTPQEEAVSRGYRKERTAQESRRSVCPGHESQANPQNQLSELSWGDSRGVYRRKLGLWTQSSLLCTL